MSKRDSEFLHRWTERRRKVAEVQRLNEAASKLVEVKGTWEPSHWYDPTIHPSATTTTITTTSEVPWAPTIRERLSPPPGEQMDINAVRITGGPLPRDTKLFLDGFEVKGVKHMELRADTNDVLLLKLELIVKMEEAPKPELPSGAWKELLEKAQHEAASRTPDPDEGDDQAGGPPQ